MRKKQESFYLSKLEWLGPILVRGLRLLTSVEALGKEFSFSQTLIMQALLGRPNMKMNELARFLGLTKANASGLVDRLVKQGLIDRQHSEEDRRVVFVHLTREGRKAAAGLVKTQRQGLTNLMRRIPDKDLGPFIQTIEQLARGLAETQPDLLPPTKQ